jgi:hypothetical protein
MAIYQHFAINRPKWALHLWQTLQRHELLVVISPIFSGRSNANLSAAHLLAKRQKRRSTKEGEGNIDEDQPRFQTETIK